MAVKGKKKSQHRGSQGRRRPAQAPRPAYTRPGHRPWYRTAGGRAAAVGIAVVVLGLVAWLVVARSDDGVAEARRSSLNRYSDAVRSLLQEVRAPASAMAAVAGPEVPREVEDDAPGWVAQLERATHRVETLPEAEGQDASRRLFKEAVLLYLDAAKTFELAATLRGDAAEEALTRAADQRNRATGVWDVATGLLDGARTEAELPSSSIGSPAGFAPGSQTTGSPEGEGSHDGGSGGKDK